MNKIRGPFIEYECSKCNTLVIENADMPREQLFERIAQANRDASARICAGCFGCGNSKQEPTP